MSIAVMQKSAAITLPKGAHAVQDGGLLAGVRRPCREHAVDCRCVGRTPEGHLVFWCEAAEHPFTAR